MPVFGETSVNRAADLSLGASGTRRKRISVDLPAEIVEALHLVAKERSSTTSSLVRWAISALAAEDSAAKTSPRDARLQWPSKELLSTSEEIVAVGPDGKPVLMTGLRLSDPVITRWPESSGIITVVDPIPDLLHGLRNFPENPYALDPAGFERVIASLLDQMGFDVRLTGHVYQRDGGIDLIAVPKGMTVAPFVLGAQMKYHSQNTLTERDVVDRMLSWKESVLRLGLIVTNTGFTADAIWASARVENRAFLRLRDLSDIKRWIRGDVPSLEDWRELPGEIELAPGITVAIPGRPA